MGCIIKKAKSSEIVPTHLSVSRSIIDLHESSLKVLRSNSKKSSMPADNDFWGTMPFYVINSRISLLSAEVKNDDEKKEIFYCILDTLSNLYKDFENDTLKTIRKAENRYKWLNKYENGVILMKNLGFVDNEKFMNLHSGITKEHISNKIKEMKYGIRKLAKQQFTV